MSLLPLFDDDVPDQAARLAPKLRSLAEQGVFFGTSSWKYPGWLGSIYSPDRYRTRGRFSKAKFDDECLAEYARTFPLVCGDFAFYQFPMAEYWKKLFSSTPDTLTVALKVPEDLTVIRWPGHPRYGVRAGNQNAHFLDASLFASQFADRLRPYASRVGPLIFEFGTFAKQDFAKPEEFLAALDGFLGSLPPGFRYAVEIRNPEYLGANYFGLLQAHNVAHVLSAWTRMPDLAEQAAMDGAFTADFTVVRALLKHGRTYDAAVKGFEPYDRLQEPNPSAREAMKGVAERSRRTKKPAFLLVNNRLEGHAPTTIEAVAGKLDV